MAVTARKMATYEDLYSIPENMTGEIIDGDLIATPRPSRKHVYAASALEIDVGMPFQFGRGGGPGGWIILLEPEIMLRENILVPDLAGWRRERFPVTEDTNSISIPPDWVCEVLSPSTVRLDKTRKMPLYGQHGIGYFWLIDPGARTLDVYRLEAGKWVVAGFYSEDDKVRAEPFQEIEIELNNLWLEEAIRPPTKEGRPKT
jgi:Uma2 family endonuclease